MASTLHISLITIWPLLTIYTVSKGCQYSWFGPECQYRCWCQWGKCNGSGDCTKQAECEVGKFGPQCQYYDLTVTERMPRTPDWLKDSRDDTCNPSENSHTETLKLIKKYPFTWLRLIVKKPGLLHNLKVYFDDNQECFNQKNIAVNDVTMDVVCDTVEFVKTIMLKGESVGFLCSLHINKGRNVALKQRAYQSSTKIEGENKRLYSASNAVDGTHDREHNSGSCASTNNESVSVWTVKFDLPQKINIYVVYGSKDTHHLLNKMEIRGYNNKGEEMVYLPAKESYDKGIYYEFVNIGSAAISKVDISLSGPLTICEVELFGDVDCPVYTFGRHCEQNCMCSYQHQLCLVATGGCYRGCPAGYYGSDCFYKCPPKCLNNICDFYTGHCLKCIEGFTGPSCYKVQNTVWIYVALAAAVIGATLTVHLCRMTETANDCKLSECDYESGLDENQMQNGTAYVFPTVKYHPEKESLSVPPKKRNSQSHHETKLHSINKSDSDKHSDLDDRKTVREQHSKKHAHKKHVHKKSLTEKISLASLREHLRRQHHKNKSKFDKHGSDLPSGPSSSLSRSTIKHAHHVHSKKEKDRRKNTEEKLPRPILRTYISHPSHAHPIKWSPDTKGPAKSNKHKPTLPHNQRSRFSFHSSKISEESFTDTDSSSNEV